MLPPGSRQVAEPAQSESSMGRPVPSRPLHGRRAAKRDDVPAAFPAGPSVLAACQPHVSGALVATVILVWRDAGKRGVRMRDYGGLSAHLGAVAVPPCRFLRYLGCNRRVLGKCPKSSAEVAEKCLSVTSVGLWASGRADATPPRRRVPSEGDAAHSTPAHRTNEEAAIGEPPSPVDARVPLDTASSRSWPESGGRHGVRRRRALAPPGSGVCGVRTEDAPAACTQWRDE